MAGILVDKQTYEMYRKAFDLLGEVADDLENYGEVMQDVTVEKVGKFFEDVDSGKYGDV